MLRKIQAVIAILSTLVVFVLFAFVKSPTSQAVYDSLSLVLEWRPGNPWPTTGVDDSQWGDQIAFLDVAPDGTVYTGQSDSSVIEIYSPSGTHINTFNAPPYEDLATAPYFISIDIGSDYVLLVNHYYVLKFNLDGTFVEKIIEYGVTPNARPISDVSRDSAGNIVVATTQDYLQKWSVEGSFISEFMFESDPMLANSATVIVDQDNNIFVSGGDHLNRVRKYNSSGVLQYENDIAEASMILDSQVDLEGNIYLMDGSRNVVKISNAGSFLWEYAWMPSPDSGTYNGPYNIALDVNNDLMYASNGCLYNGSTCDPGSIYKMQFDIPPVPTPTLPVAEWENVGSPINPGGYTGSVFVRTDKQNQDPIVAYPEYSQSESNYKVTVRRYNKNTGNWELVGNSRFSNPLTSSGQGRFSFDTCEDGRMVALIADASESDKATLYRYENGVWGVLGVAGASSNNAAYGLGMFCQPIVQLPYLYVFPDPSGVGDDLVYGYNFNPDLGGWVTIQEIPCTTTNGLTILNPNLLIGDPVNNFTWYACSNGSVSEFTGTLWNNPVSALFTSPTSVQDFDYDQGNSSWIFATENVVTNTFKVYSSPGGSAKTQMGADFDFPSVYDSSTFPASLEYNQTEDAMWYAVPTGDTTFSVKEFNGSSWNNVLSEFTETGLHADDIDLYHDPACNGANYLALAMQTGAGQSSIIVKRDSSFVPCGELPTVTTGSVSLLTHNSAMVGGNVESDGYLAIIERGIVYSTTETSPTLSDTVQSTTGTTGEMYTLLSELQSNTLYYVRAYATNSLGTAYGEVVQFTTAVQPTPTPTPSSTATVTPTPKSVTATVTPTLTGTGTVTSTPPVTSSVTATPENTITSRREAQQSPICPVILTFASSPTIAAEGERVELSWITKNTTKVTINGSLVAISGSTPLIVPADRKAKLIADNGACIASEVVNFENPAQQQLQTATAVGASALVAEILLQQAVSLGTATIGSSGAVMSTNLWGVALSIFNRRKKRQAWGIVYDSKTKNPLGRVVIRLLNVDTEAVVDTVVSDAQGVFQLKTQPGRYLIRVVRAGYQFPSTYVKGDTDGGYTHLYFGGVLTQGSADQQVTVSIPLDPEKETQAKRRTRVIFDAGFEALSTASTITLFAGFGYSLYVATLFPLPINIFASVLYGSVCIGKLLLTLWTPRTFGKVSTVTGRPLAGVEVGIFDKEFNTLLYRTFTNEKGEYNFAVPNKSYVLRLMDNTYKVYSGNNTQGIEIPAIKRKSPSEVRLIAHDLVVNLANNAAP